MLLVESLEAAAFTIIRGGWESMPIMMDSVGTELGVLSDPHWEVLLLCGTRTVDYDPLLYEFPSIQPLVVYKH